MLAHLILPFLAISVALLVTLSLMLVIKRFRRNRAERLSIRTRERYERALLTGSPADLAAMAGSVRRRRERQDDLAAALDRLGSTLDPARLAEFDAAVSASGLEQRLTSQLRSREAMRRGRAVVLAGRLRSIDVASMEPLLSDPDADVRLAAAQSIARRKEARSAWALSRALTAGVMPPERVTERLGESWAVRDLLTASHCDEFREVRPWIAEALGLSHDLRAEHVLTTLLAVGDEEERTRACRALGRLGRESSIPNLRRALEDESWRVRAQAAKAHEQFSDERSIETLGEHLSDRNWWVRANAAQALRTHGPAGLAELRERAEHDPDRYARDRAAEALALEDALTVHELKAA